MYCQNNQRVYCGVFLASLLSSLWLGTAAYSSNTFVAISKNRFENCSKILDAVLKNDVTRVKFLLEGDGLSPSRNETWNVARIAAVIGKVDIFRYAVEMEPSVLTLKNERNETVTHIAAKNGRLDVIRYIAEERPSIFSEESENIAEIAANYSRMDIVLFVAQKNDAVNAKKYGRGNGTSILNLAAIRNILDLEALKFFVEKKHFNLSTAVTEKDETIAHLAVKHDSLDLVRYMLNEEPNLSRLKDGDQKILVELALRKGNLNMVGCVLESMGSARDSDELRMYCHIAHAAVYSGKKDLLQLIVRICPSVLEEKCTGGTLAHVAAAHGRWNVLEYLATERPSMLTQRGSYGWNTPLHFIALKNGNITAQLMRFLVKKTGEAALMRNIHGKTVPEIAAENGNLDMIRCILEELPSFNGSCRVAEISIEHGYPYIFWYIAQKKPAELADERLLAIAYGERLLSVETLRREGSSLVRNSCCAFTIVRVAAENGDLEVIRYIAKKNPVAFTEKDKDGHTALHHVIAENIMSERTLKFLLEDTNPSLVDTSDKAKTSGSEEKHRSHFIWTPEESYLAPRKMETVKTTDNCWQL